MRRVHRTHSKDCALLEKAINRKLRKRGRGYGIRNLYRTAQGRYRFEMKACIDPNDEINLHHVVRAVLREGRGGEEGCESVRTRC